MKKIFVAAHYNLNNGDRAVLEATIQKINEICPDASITVSAFEPNTLIDDRFTTVGWPIKQDIISRKLFSLLTKLNKVHIIKFLQPFIIDKSYLSFLKRADVVLISGGHHLTDILGDYTFYSLAVNFLLPIYNKKKIYLLPQSIGPIDVNNKEIKNVMSYILDNSNHIAYRDNSSKKIIDKLSNNANKEYVPDIVFSLKNDKLTKEAKTVGIALYCNYSGIKKEELMPKVIENLITTIKHLLRKGYNVKIIPMEIKNSASDDRVVANQIINEIGNETYGKTLCIEEPATSNIVDIVKLFSSKDFIIAYKTHSVVFSLINHVPVIAVAYHPKSIEFMESVDLLEYAIEDSKADSEKLEKIINSIEKNHEEIVRKEEIGVNQNLEIIQNYLVNLLEDKK